jgi:beta-phosphoglucomutase-like phosphatase (HAD superfamily)
MAEPEEDDEYVYSEWREITDEDEEDDTYSDEALASFRMFHQRHAYEVTDEQEEEEDEEVSNVDENVVEEVEEDEDNEPLAEVEEITAKLQSRGITMLDLVAMLTDRKSTRVAKHTDRFINALDIILDNAITDCDREAKEAAQI